MPIIQVISIANANAFIVMQMQITFIQNIVAAFINLLLSESTEVAINQLLTHLPLLKPGNIECKQCYLVAIPELVSHCITTGQYTEQTQQLLSYCLIHPAITSQDRRSLTQWLRHLEERISGTPPIHSLEEYTNTTIR